MGKKYAINKNFFKKWNPEMAYVLGYLYADGSLEDASYLRGKYVRVSSTDEITIKNIKGLLSSGHKIVKISSNQRNRKNKYLLRVGDHFLYDSLLKKGLFPNKSLSMSLPCIPKKYIKDFVRGYFDGDGCVYIERRQLNNENRVTRLRVIFTSGSKIFLEKLLQSLKLYYALESGKVYKSRRSFQLVYGTKDAIHLFKVFYNKVREKLYLNRKAMIFLGYFKERPGRVDKTILSIVNYLNNGHVVK